MSLATEAIIAEIEASKLLPRAAGLTAIHSRLGYQDGLEEALDAVRRAEIDAGMQVPDPIDPCPACDGQPPVLLVAGWPLEMRCKLCGHP